MEIIKKPRKKVTYYKVRDSENKWVTMSFKTYGATVLTSFNGGKVYTSTSSFQNILKKFITYAKLKGSVKYGNDKISLQNFQMKVLDWKVIPFFEGDPVDMVFFADSFR
jgi:hypothetical protein